MLPATNLLVSLLELDPLSPELPCGTSMVNENVTVMKVGAAHKETTRSITLSLEVRLILEIVPLLWIFVLSSMPVDLMPSVNQLLPTFDPVLVLLDGQHPKTPLVTSTPFN